MSADAAAARRAPRVVNVKPSQQLAYRPSPTVRAVLRGLGWDEVELPEEVHRRREELSRSAEVVLAKEAAARRGREEAERMRREGAGEEEGGDALRRELAYKERLERGPPRAAADVEEGDLSPRDRAEARSEAARLSPRDKARVVRKHLRELDRATEGKGAAAEKAEENAAKTGPAPAPAAKKKGSKRDHERQGMASSLRNFLAFDELPPSVRWDLAWVGSATRAFFKTVAPHRKVNQVPGVEALTKKRDLAESMERMRAAFPADYDFHPESFRLPMDYDRLERHEQARLDAGGAAGAGSDEWWIVKPSAMCQGIGIYVTNRLDKLCAQRGRSSRSRVVQRYVANPHLVDGLKYDLRLYAVLTSSSPLRVYLYGDGLARFCTDPYSPPAPDGAGSHRNLRAHLTNYSVNKASESFVFNTDAEADGDGSKWSVRALMERLRKDGHDTDALWQSIHAVVAKTCAAVQPRLSHEYRVRFPGDADGGRCFQLLGFDVMFDSAMKPWLIEVNRNPSLKMDTPLDAKIKAGMMSDLLQLVNPAAYTPPGVAAAATPAGRKAAMRGSMGESFRARREREARERADALARRVGHEEAFAASHSTGFTRVCPAVFTLDDVPVDPSAAPPPRVLDQYRRDGDTAGDADALARWAMAAHRHNCNLQFMMAAAPGSGAARRRGSAKAGATSRRASSVMSSSVGAKA